MRVFLRVAYDGSNYHGWQFQEGQPTIEGELLKSLKALLRLSEDSDFDVMGASRTDAGVHALGNAAVFDTDSSIPPDRYSYALNDILPEDIRVMESFQVPDDFNPRFDAKNKTYEYIIETSRVLLPTKRLYAYHYRGPLDVDAMNEAAGFLVGEHDFTSFSSVHAQVKSFVRTIFSCEVFARDCEVIIRVNGNGFLYNMVRIIAGTLLDVGTKKTAPKNINAILEAKDRCAAGQTLPPQGLTLVNICYGFPEASRHCN